MKRQLTVLALTLAAAPTVFAQSTVTLYGVIDEGLNYTNNTGGNHNWEMASGYAYGSRWGLKGNEDLGGGMKAIFALENGFDLNTGRANQGGRMFGRQAYAGVSSQYGAITLGRQYDSVVDYAAPTTANGNWAGYLFAHPYDNDNTDNSFRVSNSVKYASPNLGGFQFGGVYGFSNTAGQFANNRLMSVGASYSNGPITLGAAYMDIDNVGNGTAGAVASNDASFFAGHQREVVAGVNYKIGLASVGFAYSHVRLENPTGNGYLTPPNFPTGVSVSSLSFDNFEINGQYYITPSFFVGAMYTYTRGSYNASNGSSHPNWNQVGLMADYNLSKRTDIYVQGVYQKVSGSTGTFLDQAYITGSDNSSSTNKQVVARVALRHLF